ncbi:CRP/FNR family transcriptional regulator [Kerstersia gyiorum]|uniref:CRP/FNR family transcriptional regulator n=1 Tax=Kerstersia gyiorum TaxID=206506 RepID=A0A4Q7MB90_9BURK|nr:fumarate/nitrate reduction transcriptional regulator Fnr [Kerstersia gyiorum]KAB0542026.1 fumarate/nitrate reduction transcriptional regulator Fnr [Kerstersia gyiorum]RZS65021.1 CRP/FNR family transcriptional regulator [Kerstersia gyiorum]
MAKRVLLPSEAVHCSSCMLGHVCLPIGMSTHDVAKLDGLIKERLRIEKGKPLYTLNEPLTAIYSVRIGTLKTQIENAQGQFQITGFHLPGEIVGLDGMIEGHHVSTAVALEDAEVCVIRLEDMDNLARHLPSLQQQVLRLMSREISRSHQMLMALGSMRAEQRLAAFLLNLSTRLSALGYSSTEFVMRMSREEIGNYLGLALETVSRLFSRFAREELIRVNQRQVQLLDKEKLHKLIEKEKDAV